MHTISGNGVRLFINIGGFAGSSTRTEIAAGIIAMCAYGPVHIGSDSEVFVNGANELIEDIKANKVPRHNWKLVSDGDLWEHFYKAILAKGPQSTRPTWVKGHATQEHIDKGITTIAHKAGNHEADATADLGTDLHGADTMLKAKCMHARHNKYLALM